VVVGCRYKTNIQYEITMEEEKAKTKLMDGFKIKDTAIMGRALTNKEMVVSFLGLPLYITDEVIREKLRVWGVSATSPRRWPGTDILEGMRFFKVQFTDFVQSLPYSTRFETLEGAEYFRVIHDRQVKVCRMCIQPGHILRECPDFKCRKCGTQGHYAWECELQEQRGGEGPHGDEATTAAEVAAAAEVARAAEVGGASESGAEGGSGEQQMEEDGEKDREEDEMQNGEAEVDTASEATPREAGG